MALSKKTRELQDSSMESIVIKIDPDKLINPDLDIRYLLPDMLIAQSNGIIEDAGYDYASDESTLLLFFKVHNLAQAIACIREIVANQTLLGNSLAAAATVAVRHNDSYEVVYPEQFDGVFVC